MLPYEIGGPTPLPKQPSQWAQTMLDNLLRMFITRDQAFSHGQHLPLELARIGVEESSLVMGWEINVKIQPVSQSGPPGRASPGTWDHPTLALSQFFLCFLHMSLSSLCFQSADWRISVSHAAMYGQHRGDAQPLLLLGTQSVLSLIWCRKQNRGETMQQPELEQSRGEDANCGRWWMCYCRRGNQYIACSQPTVRPGYVKFLSNEHLRIKSYFRKM